AHFTSSEKASSVPGGMHTAIVESSGAANPRVPVLKYIQVWWALFAPKGTSKDIVSKLTPRFVFCLPTLQPDNALPNSDRIFQHRTNRAPRHLLSFKKLRLRSGGRSSRPRTSKVSDHAIRKITRSPSGSNRSRLP